MNKDTTGQALDTGSSVRDRRGVEKGIDVSIVIPLQNEEENVRPLYEEIVETLSDWDRVYEIIFVDDSSYDRTVEILKEIAGDNPRVVIVELCRKYGQTAGLAAGFGLTRGRIVVPMDGDLQNDPRDIPRLVARIDEGPGWDIVSGWRKDRHDKFLTRRLPSILANWVIRRLTWTSGVHDFGCTLKAYRHEVIQDVRLYGEMHRFLPAICRWRGARITEEVVTHRPRIHGESKYGLRRIVKVLFDLLTVKFLGDYLAKPLYFFGKVALASVAVSFVALGVAIAQKFGYLTAADRLPLNRNVLVLLAVMLFLMAVMLIMMGVISELLVRIYHESQGYTPYKIRRITRGGEKQES